MNCVPLISESPSFACSRTGSRPTRSSATPPGKQLALEPGLPLADERQREVRERCEVAARADRAAARHVRQQPAVDALDQELDRLDARARVALRERVRAQQHRRAHDLGRVRLADAARVAAEEPQLELLGQLLRDRRRDEPAEPRVDPVGVLARPVRGALDQLAGGAHPVSRRVGERDGRPLHGDVPDVVDREVFAAQRATLDHGASVDLGGGGKVRPMPARKLNRSLWLEPAETRFPSLASTLDVDVAVIGAGITGVTTAHLLKQAGKTVALIESNGVGYGATGYTTAKLTVGHSLVYHDLIESFGEEAARAYARSNQEAIERIRAIVRDNSIDCDLERASNYVYTEREASVARRRAGGRGCAARRRRRGAHDRDRSSLSGSSRGARRRPGAVPPLEVPRRSRGHRRRRRKPRPRVDARDRRPQREQVRGRDDFGHRPRVARRRRDADAVPRPRALLHASPPDEVVRRSRLRSTPNAHRAGCTSASTTPLARSVRRPRTTVAAC